MRSRMRIELSAGIAALLLCTAPAVFAQGAKMSPDDGASAADREKTAIDPDALREGRATVDLLNAPGLSRGVDAIIEEIRKREVELSLREQRIAERERAEIDIGVDVGIGSGRATIWTCDLTHRYIEINADYRS